MSKNVDICLLTFINSYDKAEAYLNLSLMMDMNIEGDESRITCKNAGFVVEWDETQKVFKAYMKAE